MGDVRIGVAILGRSAATAHVLVREKNKKICKKMKIEVKCNGLHYVIEERSMVLVKSSQAQRRQRWTARTRW